MSSELWKPVKGYEGKYEVSSLGRIKSLNFNQKQYEKILKPYINVRTKYAYVGLSKHCKLKTMPIHRLVAEAFIPNPENKCDVNHKDCNRANNKVENLEWCTRSENIKYGIKYGNIKCNFLKRVKGNNETQ